MKGKETITKIDNIRFLFGQIEKGNRKEFFERVAAEFEMKATSVRVGWFTRFDIPDKYKVQDRLIAFMQKYINNQKLS